MAEQMTARERAVLLLAGLDHFGNDRLDDALSYLADAFERAEQAAAERAERAQMEKDCAAVCYNCRNGRPLEGAMHVWIVGSGDLTYRNVVPCYSTGIRDWRNAHAQPASGGEV